VTAMSKVQPDVVVFDDRPLLVEATVEFLRRAPEIGRVAGTADESALFAQLRNHADLLLLWVDHTGGSSIAQILKAARQRQPRLSVLVVDPTGSHPELVDVLVGASVSVIDGDRSADALVAAIRQVASGHVVVPAGLAAAVLRLVAGSPNGGPDVLATRVTRRELEILELLAAGVDRVAIARRLGLSPNTVRTHIGHMMTKLQVHSEVELVAMERRLLPLHSALSYG